MSLLRAAALSLFVATVHLHAQVETRDPLPVPDLPGTGRSKQTG
jgi:hypothetical protein